MVAILKGETVVLHEKVQTDTDAFHNPIYEEIPTAVENILISPVSSEDATTDLQLTGKHAVYELSIPKGDDHTWEDAKVSFYGEDWRTFGFVRQWNEALVPLRWNKKIKVERHG